MATTAPLAKHRGLGWVAPRMSDERQLLEALAGLYGVGLSYFDIKGNALIASNEALYVVLRGLGAQVDGPADLPGALLNRKRALAQTVLEPVNVIWESGPSEVLVRLPQPRLGPARLILTLESGEVRALTADLRGASVYDQWQVEGQTYERRRFDLGSKPPLGYHQLRLEVDGQQHEGLLISAPERAFCPEQQGLWGVFAPTYALHGQESWGGGGLAELALLFRKVRSLGGSFVGTLPLMAAFLDQAPFEPSPYAPVSRLFWNELFLDLSLLPELSFSEAARQRLASPALATQKEALRKNPLVDYAAQYALVRSVLEPLAQAAWSHEGVRWNLDDWSSKNPAAADYARFRATTERHGPWHTWPQRLKDGQIEPTDYDQGRYEFHLYVQMRMDQQVRGVASQAKGGAGGLYLDMPLGVHPDGYDAWRHQQCFMGEVSAGAPPDDLFSGGQDWGFRPLHPDAIRTDRYRYVIACLRHQLRSAGALRVDHVMGLERIFCVPKGLGGKHGIYVYYRADELYAILTLESVRHQCLVIGEDLGTVPDSVRERMNRHGFLRMYVGQFAMNNDPAAAVNPPPGPCVASLNTHDTPTFAAFWDATDIEDRVRLGHTLAADAVGERASRQAQKAAVSAFLRDKGLLGAAPKTADVLRALLTFIAQSEARLMLVNAEDLWLEHQPQNVPGTVHESPNWQKRAAHPLEAWDRIPGLIETLRIVAAARAR